MSHQPSGKIEDLPENARRPLEGDERYVPVVPDESGVHEVTTRSVVMGLVFCAIFAMAAAYLALKVGQGIEAAIPIAILAIGLSRLFARRSTILENVIVQSIGANSSHVVSGAVFTIPALFMLAADPVYDVMQPGVWQIITVSFLGGCVGILFVIPLRYHFMVEMHGKFPWPEGTATTEILLSGERVGGQAIILTLAAAGGALYDGLVITFHAMADQVRFKALYIGDFLNEQFMTLRILNNAAIVGIGYIIGIKYAAVICAGSFLSYFVLVPIAHAIGQHVGVVLPPGDVPIGEMNIDGVFSNYVRIIGVGGIAGAGIMGILSSLPSMIKSIGSNIAGMKSQDTRAATEVPRVDRSLSGSFTLVGILIFMLAAFLFFSFGLGLADAMLVALVGTILVSIIAFLFAPVAARAIAIVGTNPVSGMTMLTLIITGFVLLKMGLSGGMGMFLTMTIGGVVCTALAASGALASDLKVGHWIGATPAKQLGLKFVGTLVAATFCGIAMWLLARQGFGSENLPAPQASAMKEVLVGIFGTVAAPLRWYLFWLGVIVSVILRMAGVPALAFALGMYLPMQLNTPVMLGGFLSWIAQRKWGGEGEARVKARYDRGVLIASGLVAGGAIWGVIDAIFIAIAEKSDGFAAVLHGAHILPDVHWGGGLGDTLGFVGLAILCTAILYFAWQAKPEKGES